MFNERPIVVLIEKHGCKRERERQGPADYIRACTRVAAGTDW